MVFVFVLSRITHGNVYKPELGPATDVFSVQYFPQSSLAAYLQTLQLCRVAASEGRRYLLKVFDRLKYCVNFRPRRSLCRAGGKEDG